MNDFSKGDFVCLKGSRKVYQVIEGPNRKDEYLLSLGSAQMWVVKDRLEMGKAPKKSARKTVTSLCTSNTEQEVITLDLHGFSTSAAEIELERTLDRALLKNCDCIQVIHGIGTGVLKETVHRYLENSSNISRYALDVANPGTTWVYL